MYFINTADRLEQYVIFEIKRLGEENEIESERGKEKERMR
jgi:hypothetical protein